MAEMATTAGTTVPARASLLDRKMKKKFHRHGSAGRLLWSR